MKNVLNFKIIGALLLSMVIFGTVQAQDAKIGFRVGANLFNQSFKGSNLNYNTDGKLGLDLALVGDFPMGEVISVSPELHWLQKGSKFEDLNGTLGEITSSLNYLELPILLKFRLGGEDLAFNVFGGPSFGYLLSGKDKDHDGQTNDIDFDFYKRIELGLHAGVGVQVGPALIDLRYMYGVSKIYVSNISGTDVEITNHGLGAGVSVMF